MKLWKMHGAGNDFLIADNRDGKIKDKSHFALTHCDRHFGMGGDGFIALEDSANCDLKMAYFNADGTEDSMCGNGIRCLAKYARDNGIVDALNFTIETKDGAKEIVVVKETKMESQIKINMGSYSYSAQTLQIQTTKEEFISSPLTMADGRIFDISGIHLGVNHAIIFVDESIDFAGLYGEQLEKNTIFLADMNFNFVEYLDRSHLKVSTWERGVGKTLACGTGSSAAVVMANRLLGTEQTVEVQVPGGQLRISLQENGNVFMEGPATKVGEIIIT